jgi:uncharacterized protein YjdB
MVDSLKRQMIKLKQLIFIKTNDKMKTKKTLSTWLVIILTTFSMPVLAQFSGSGGGTLADPYIITSGDELYQVRSFLNNPNVYFKMLNDIDLTQWIAENNPTQGWLPIGNSSSNAFRGNFNGNNCKIIGLKISRSTTDYVGLFGYLSTGASIYDLSLSQCNVTGKNYSGILIGYTNVYNSIRNVTIQGDLIGNDYTGILAGYIFIEGNSVINNINIQGNVTGNNYVGIFAGFIKEDLLYYASASFTAGIDNVSLQGDLVGKSNVGGLAGGIKCYLSTSSSYTVTAIISLSNISVEGTVAGEVQTGGIVGNVDTKGYIVSAKAYVNTSNILFKGNVTGKDYTGGLYGNFICLAYGYINIGNSGFWGDVSGSNYVGGIVGQLTNNTSTNHSIKIYNCTSTGNITGLERCGGILGGTPDLFNILADIHNCYSHCDVSGTISVGGIVGKGYRQNIINNYSTGKNIRGTSNVGGIIGESSLLTGSTETTVHSNVSINNVISGGSSVGRIIGNSNLSETLTSGQSNYGWALSKVIVNNINTTVLDSYLNGNTSGLSLLKKKTTYQGIGWDFTTVNYWNIVENQSFPYFSWQTPPAVITTSPIKAGNTTISGTSVANATINVKVGGKEYTTTASSLNWTLEVDPLLGGDQILVISKQDGLAWSYALKVIVEFQGSGTLVDPYQIYTANDLKAIESNLSTNYKLMNDIDLTSWIQTNGTTIGWQSIGTMESSLLGSLDGDNHKITGFWQNSSQKSCGLIASLSTDGAVRNLTIEPAAGKNISGLDYSAIVTGYNYGTIENCKVSGTVQGYNVGSIAGFNSGTIKNCIGSGLIISIVSAGKAGGIAGDNTGLITSCEYTGDITCNIGSGYLGGITGSNTTNVVNCYYSGNLLSSVATSHIGGIVGLNTGLINTCFSMGVISASGATAYAGGIAGDNNSTTSEINNSQSAMNITSSGTSTVCGGIVGLTKGKVTNCYSTSNIVSGYRGSGVVGYMDGTSAIVKGCVGLNTNISGKNSVNRVLGGTMNSATAPTLTDNYGCKDMLITINGVTQSTPADNYMQGTAKIRTDLKKRLFYEGISWDFVSSWFIVDGFDYPYLRFRLKPVTTVSLNKSSTSLRIGANETLTATIAPTNATYQYVTWSSNNTSVATVDDAGKITAVLDGTATITATAVDPNITAQCVVEVVLSTSLNETLNKNIKIYPNPAENYLKLNSETQNRYSIFSSTGIMIKSNLNVGINSIDISKLQQGYYFIKIDNEVIPFIKK